MLQELTVDVYDLVVVTEYIRKLSRYTCMAAGHLSNPAFKPLVIKVGQFYAIDKPLKSCFQVI